MAKSKDLFEESSMSFGEHLEVLRIHMIRAIIGLVIACCFTLFYGQELVDYISRPIKEALVEHYDFEMEDFNQEEEVTTDPSEEQTEEESTSETDASVEHDPKAESDPNAVNEPSTAHEPSDVIKVKIPVAELAPALHEVSPEQFPESEIQSDKQIEISLQSPHFKDLNRFRNQQNAINQIIEKQAQPVTREVHEAFLVYLKVSIVSGLVLSSPWIIYQLWLFVAAGLYPTERRYVYYYLPFSVGLFLTGVLFCFYLVLPYVLSFLLGFNKSMGISPQIFLREWISFAIMLPVMFGISFQLPIVMLFMERIGICTVETYREKRRMSILIISIVSMLMTPSDPQSMILMMIPLLILYEVGILMCNFRVNPSTEPDSI
ncbi:MAG: twin-arginine translocase subunit TatC [Planctomycetaceae bacterium]